MPKYLFLAFLFLKPLLTGAQVAYDDFFLFQQNNVVLVSWTVKSGSLCNGTTVYRTSENGNDQQVAYIEGICGSDIEDKSYSVVDANPVLNANNTYYIQFGFGEYSEEKTIYVRYLDPAVLYLSPNPAGSSVTIEWNDEYHENYSVTILNAQGQTVHSETDVFGNSLQLPVVDFPSGTYLVSVTSVSGKQLLARLVKIQPE